MWLEPARDSSFCQVAESILPVAGRPFAVWKAASARRVFVPPLPSITPGEKAARSSRTWTSPIDLGLGPPRGLTGAGWRAGDCAGCSTWGTIWICGAGWAGGGAGGVWAAKRAGDDRRNRIASFDIYLDMRAILRVQGSAPGGPQARRCNRRAMAPAGYNARRPHERQEAQPLLLHRPPARHGGGLLPHGADLLRAGAAGGGVRDPLLSHVPVAPARLPGAEDARRLLLLPGPAAPAHRAPLPGGRPRHP